MAAADEYIVITQQHSARYARMLHTSRSFVTTKARSASSASGPPPWLASRQYADSHADSWCVAVAPVRARGGCSSVWKRAGFGSWPKRPIAIDDYSGNHQVDVSPRGLPAYPGCNNETVPCLGQRNNMPSQRPSAVTKVLNRASIAPLGNLVTFFSREFEPSALKGSMFVIWC